MSLLAIAPADLLFAHLLRLPQCIALPNYPARQADRPISALMNAQTGILVSLERSTGNTSEDDKYHLAVATNARNTSEGYPQYSILLQRDAVKLVELWTHMAAAMGYSVATQD